MVLIDSLTGKDSTTALRKRRDTAYDFSRTTEALRKFDQGEDEEEDEDEGKN